MYSSGYINNYIDHELRHINNLQGTRFEKYTCKLLKDVGYRNVYRTQDSGDFGLDIIAYNSEGRKIGFQCKLYSSMVGYQAIEDVNAGMDFYGISKGIVIINNYFTHHAIRGCKNINHNNPYKMIDLWDINKLKQLIKQSFFDQGLFNGSLLYQVFLNHINPKNNNDLLNERKFIKSVIKHSQSTILNNIIKCFNDAKLSLPYNDKMILNMFMPIKANDYITLIKFSYTAFQKQINYSENALMLLNNIFRKIGNRSKIIFIPDYKWIHIQYRHSNRKMKYPLLKIDCWDVHDLSIKSLFMSKYYLSLILKYIVNCDSNRLTILFHTFKPVLIRLNNELNNIEDRCI